MKLFLSYIRLVRPLNLLMIVFTLYMVRAVFLLPLYIFNDRYHDRNWDTGTFTFILFSLSYILIAAAGYIINDYYDVRIDRINKPEKAIVGNTISKSSALTAYWILNICGLIIGFWSCHRAEFDLLGLLFVFYVVGLWFYSYKLKSTFLLGNSLIAIFLGLVPFAAASIEIEENFGLHVFFEYYQNTFSDWRTGAIFIAGFAFLSTFIREIIKDMEDMEGDRSAGCHTVSIVWGIKKTRILVQFLILLMMGFLVRYQFWCYNKNMNLSVIYMAFFVQIPCFFAMWKLYKASAPKNFHNVSTLLKNIMLTGICYLFVFVYDACSNYAHLRIHHL